MEKLIQEPDFSKTLDQLKKTWGGMKRRARSAQKAAVPDGTQLDPINKEICELCFTSDSNNDVEIILSSEDEHENDEEEIDNGESDLTARTLDLATETLDASREIAANQKATQAALAKSAAGNTASCQVIIDVLQTIANACKRSSPFDAMIRDVCDAFEKARTAK
ncbi:hypothetical protein QAD02_002475 [Eretmocerus hayati]|uniref:Uncharacterized protein n=1 Tax=Eretmocerus hayati TaxID=131215 RepID=A0ACC2NKS1_9HYME|nr:hypothetical protein QAD02_002475 [Eretmocerus hayati]